MCLPADISAYLKHKLSIKDSPITRFPFRVGVVFLGVLVASPAGGWRVPGAAWVTESDSSDLPKKLILKRKKKCISFWSLTKLCRFWKKVVIVSLNGFREKVIFFIQEKNNSDRQNKIDLLATLAKKLKNNFHCIKFLFVFLCLLRACIDVSVCLWLNLLVWRVNHNWPE